MGGKVQFKILGNLIEGKQQKIRNEKEENILYVIVYKFETKFLEKYKLPTLSLQHTGPEFSVVNEIIPVLT